MNQSYKVYISGPITGQPNGNKGAFDSAESHMIAQGHTAVNPHSLPHNHDKSWESYMREDIKAMLDCDAIHLLPGWEESRGARIEEDLAFRLGFKVIMI